MRVGGAQSQLDEIADPEPKTSLENLVYYARHKTSPSHQGDRTAQRTGMDCPDAAAPWNQDHLARVEKDCVLERAEPGRFSSSYVKQAFKVVRSRELSTVPDRPKRLAEQNHYRRVSVPSER